MSFTQALIYNSSTLCVIFIVHIQLWGHIILQQNLSKNYRFEKADTLYEHFNKFINTMKKEREQEETRKTIHG